MERYNENCYVCGEYIHHQQNPSHTIKNMAFCSDECKQDFKSGNQ